MTPSAGSSKLLQAPRTLVSPIYFILTSLSYTVYIGILVILVFLIYFIFPETKNLTIEEIAVIFDGERAIGMQDQDKIEDGPQKEDIKPTTVSPSYEHVDAVQK